MCVISSPRIGWQVTCPNVKWQRHAQQHWHVLAWAANNEILQWRNEVSFHSMLTCEHGKMPIKLCTCWQIWLDPHDFLARDPTDLSLCDQKSCFKRKEKSYQSFLNVTQLEPGLDKLRIFHPTPLPHLVKTRCCQAHGLCFLSTFLCLLVEVERNLRMLEVVPTNLYIATVTQRSPCWPVDGWW